MKIRINVTKEILQRSMMCGHFQKDNTTPPVVENCAVALAVREIAPEAKVGYMTICWSNDASIDTSNMPIEVMYFIKEFDSLVNKPEKRLDITPISFEVDFPEALVEKIGIFQVKEILSKSESLQMI